MIFAYLVNSYQQKIEIIEVGCSQKKQIILDPSIAEGRSNLLNLATLFRATKKVSKARILEPSFTNLLISPNDSIFWGWVLPITFYF